MNGPQAPGLTIGGVTSWVPDSGGTSFRITSSVIQLASDPPAAVLSDVLGIDIATATRWAGCAKRDWQTYLAHSHETAQQR